MNDKLAKIDHAIEIEKEKVFGLMNRDNPGFELLIILNRIEHLRALRLQEILR